MILKLFLFWRLGLFAITYLGSKAFAISQNGGLGAPSAIKPFDYWLSWAQWDGGYYYNIAQKGYILFNDFAFFPLYPALISLIPSNTLFSGLVISNLAFLLFLKIFYEFLKNSYSKQTAKNTIFTFLCFPTTFFAVAFYSEGLFLFLVIFAFVLMYKNKTFESALVIAFASLARFVAVFLIISIFYNLFKTAKVWSSKTLLILPSTFGILAYSIYLFAKTNDPFIFANTQSFWQRSVSDPISTMIGHLWQIAANPIAPLDKYFDLAVTAGFLAILIWGAKKIPSSLWIFSMLVILIPASTGTLTSMPRYVLGALGTFIIIGNFLGKHPKVRYPLWAVSLVLQAILAVRFINGWWVA